MDRLAVKRKDWGAETLLVACLFRRQSVGLPVCIRIPKQGPFLKERIRGQSVAEGDRRTTSADVGVLGL